MIDIKKVPIEWVEQFEHKISWEEAISIGLELREDKDNSTWNLGDLALKVENVYGVDSLGKFAIDININKKSLQQYRRVSAAFPPTDRSKILSHRHHLILAGHEDRLDWLKKCEMENITTSQLELMFSTNPQKIIEKREFTICQTCHKPIINPSNVCGCSPKPPGTTINYLGPLSTTKIKF